MCCLLFFTLFFFFNRPFNVEKRGWIFFYVDSFLSRYFFFLPALRRELCKILDSDVYSELLLCLTFTNRLAHSVLPFFLIEKVCQMYWEPWESWEWMYIIPFLFFAFTTSGCHVYLQGGFEVSVFVWRFGWIFRKLI